MLMLQHFNTNKSNKNYLWLSIGMDLDNINDHRKLMMLHAFDSWKNLLKDAQ